MNEEIKEILDLLKRCDNTYLKIENSNGEKEYEYHQVNDLRLDGYHSQLLLNYITNLQQKIDLYENPDDMTLFYMWLDAKVKDKIKELQQRIDKTIEYIEHEDWNTEYDKKLLNILQGSDEE